MFSPVCRNTSWVVVRCPVPVEPAAAPRRPKSASKKSENPVGSSKSYGIPPSPDRGDARYVRVRPAGAPPNPNCSCQFGPSVSYLWRFSGSDSTSYASLISLQRLSALLSPGFTSAWYLRASLLYAFLMSSALADLLTPRIL